MGAGLDEGENNARRQLFASDVNATGEEEGGGQVEDPDSVPDSAFDGELSVFEKSKYDYVIITV